MKSRERSGNQQTHATRRPSCRRLGAMLSRFPSPFFALREHLAPSSSSPWRESVAQPVETDPQDDCQSCYDFEGVKECLHRLSIPFYSVRRVNAWCGTAQQEWMR